MALKSKSLRSTILYTVHSTSTLHYSNVSKTTYDLFAIITFSISCLFVQSNPLTRVFRVFPVKRSALDDAYTPGRKGKGKSSRLSNV